jgi:polar amino acid transport system substrate-binding protein
MIKMKHFGFAFLILAGLSFALFTGCSKQQSAKPQSTANAQPAAAAQPAATAQAQSPIADGEMTVASSPDFPPYESIGPKGDVVGFEIDMAHAIAKQLGVKCTIVKQEFDSILPAIATGKADIGMSGFSVTEERKKAVDFTVDITDEPQVIMVKKGSSIKSPADLAGKKVGSQNGTIGLDLAKYEPDLVAKSNFAKTMGKPKEGVGYDDDILAAEDLKQGKIDAIIYDYTPLQQIAAKYPELEVLKDSSGKVIDLY